MVRVTTAKKGRQAVSDKVHPMIDKPDSSTHYICPQGPSDDSTHHLVPMREGPLYVQRCRYCRKSDSQIRADNGLGL